MRYSFISAAILALASSVFAQTAGFDAITSPSQGQSVAAGSSLDIIWQPGSQTGTITITLLQGSSPSTLSLGQTVASSIDNTLGKFTWSVPSNLGSDSTFGFKITLDSAPTTFQFSFPFQITGGSTSSSSASGSYSASSATGSSASTLTNTMSSGTTPVSSTATFTSANSTSISSTTSPSSDSTSFVASNTTGSSSFTPGSSFKRSSTGSAASQTSSSGPATTSAAATQPSSDAISNMAASGFTMLSLLIFSMAMIL